MTLNSKKLENSQLELTVDLDEKDLKNYIAEVEKHLANNLKLEGFRVGKVPPDIARKHLGPEIISQEALTFAVQSSLTEALEKEKLDLIDYPTGQDFKIQENSSKKLTYRVVLTVFPEIKLGKYTGLDLKRKESVVNEPEIKKVLHDLQELRTQRHNVDRPAQIGDRVEIDFSITTNGKEIPSGKSQNHPLVLGKDIFIPGFEEQIVCMKANDKKNFSLKVPDDYYQKDISGKEIEIELTVKKIENLVKSNLDNDFAKSLGNFNNLQELEDNIRQGLTLEKEAKEKDKLRIEILNQIVSQSSFSVPQFLVEKRLNSLIQEFDQELHQKGMELGPYLAHIKQTQDGLRKEWRTKAESQVKMSLVARAIGQSEKIKISDEEITQELAVLADNYAKQGILEDLQNTDPQVIKSKIHDLLFNEKVFDFLEKNNVIG